MKRTIKFSDSIRKAIDVADISRYRLSILTGIAQATLSRFMAGKGGLSTEGLDKIADVLGLTVVVKSNRQKGRK